MASKKLVIKFSYTVEGWNAAAKYLCKHGREDLVLKWKDDWQSFMVIFEGNCLYREKLREKSGTTKRKTSNN